MSFRKDYKILYSIFNSVAIRNKLFFFVLYFLVIFDVVYYLILNIDAESMDIIPLFIFAISSMLGISVLLYYSIKYNMLISIDISGFIISVMFLSFLRILLLLALLLFGELIFGLYSINYVNNYFYGFISVLYYISVLYLFRELCLMCKCEHTPAVKSS